MASVCAACRDSKVKCELVDQPHLKACARCVRIGLTCQAAEASQRGKRSSASRLSELNKRRLNTNTSGAFDSQNAIVRAQGTSGNNSICDCSDEGRFIAFWTGYVSGTSAAKNSRYIAIQMAGRARQYNRPDYMVWAMALCAHYTHSVEDVLANSVSSDPLPSTIDDYPGTMAAMLRTSSGYATGRSAAGGFVTCVANASFEAAIMTKCELDTAACDPASACADLFGFRGSAYMHPDDKGITHKFTAEMLSATFDQEDTVLSMEVPSLVRVADRRMRCYVPCSARGMMQLSACHRTPAAPLYRSGLVLLLGALCPTDGLHRLPPSSACSLQKTRSSSLPSSLFRRGHLSRLKLACPNFRQWSRCKGS